MAGASDDCLSNICRHVAHDNRLERTKRFLSADCQYGHRQLHLLEDFVVLCVLRKGSKLGEPSSHTTRLGVSCRKEVSCSLIGFGRIGCEVIPYAIKVDALTASHQPFRVGPMKVEVPNSGVQENLRPGLDPRNRCVHHHQSLNLIRVDCCVCVGHHVADVMCDHECFVISKPGHDGANVLRLCLLVVSTFRLR